MSKGWLKAEEIARKFFHPPFFRKNRALGEKQVKIKQTNGNRGGQTK